MYNGVIDVKPFDDYKIELTFGNNEKRIFDVKPYLETGMFSELKDQKIFSTVRISFDTVEWQNGADLDPEILYQDSFSTETTQLE